MLLWCAMCHTGRLQHMSVPVTNESATLLLPISLSVLIYKGNVCSLYLSVIRKSSRFLLCI